MEDLKLVQECLNGNSRAQKTLFDKFAPRMMAVCFRYMRGKDNAEDAFQLGMIKVFAKLAEFKFEGPLEGWIRRIMVNTCLDQLRKNQRLISDVGFEEVAFKMEVSEAVLSSMNTEALMALIQSMPTGYRVVFNMFAIEGFSHQEIAQKMGVSESTSKSQYLRARAYLRQRIEENKHGRGQV
ncbi:MAG: RNA polymerase sigma factor [Bacteroidetes bacterium]|nr:RNA polymerase sigma factor [Bacteroidota bacterium]